VPVMRPISKQNTPLALSTDFSNSPRFLHTALWAFCSATSISFDFFDKRLDRIEKLTTTF